MTRGRAGALWPGGPVELPAYVEIDGERYMVREQSTLDLFAAISGGQWTRLVPHGLRRRDLHRVAWRLYDPADPLDLPHLWAVACGLAGRLAGVDVDEGHDPAAAWWPAHRLAALARAHWLSFEGYAAVRGCGDLLDGPLHRLIAVAWQFAVDHRPTDGNGDKAQPITVEALRERLWTPPGPHRSQVMRFTASREREAALAALGDVLPT